MEEQKTSSDYTRQRDHFLKKDMIKMDMGKSENKSKPSVRKFNFIRLSLNNEMYLPAGPHSPKHQAFLKIAKNQVLNMDKKQGDFLQKAAKEMVKDVLKQEFGKNFMDDEGFSHMQEAITDTLLHNTQYKKILQKLLGLMNDLQTDETE